MNSNYSGIIGCIIAVILCTIVSSKISHKKTDGQFNFIHLGLGQETNCGLI
jgi:hypothetical protein